VFAANPGATPFQVLRQLKNTAVDMGPAGRDPGTGAGLINPRAAVTLPLPKDDAFESNADIPQVARYQAIRPTTSVSAFAAVDDDPTDVYPVSMRKGQVLRLTGRANGVKTRLAIWAPGTRTITSGAPAAKTAGSSRSPRLAYAIPRTGRWYVSVRAVAGSGQYALKVAG